MTWIKDNIVAMAVWFIVLAMIFAVFVVPAYPCDVGDVDGDGAIDGEDAFYLLYYVFSGGAAPVPCADSISYEVGEEFISIDTTYNRYGYFISEDSLFSFIDYWVQPYVVTIVGHGDVNVKMLTGDVISDTSFVGIVDFRGVSGGWGDPE